MKIKKIHGKYKEQCKEIIKHEDSILKDVFNYIKKYKSIKTFNEEVKFLVRLWWMNNTEENGSVYLERPKIIRGYMARLEILFYNREDQINDHDNDNFISEQFLITIVQKSFVLRRWEFIYLNHDNIHKTFENDYKVIQKYGYDKALNYI